MCKNHEIRQRSEDIPVLFSRNKPLYSGDERLALLGGDRPSPRAFTASRHLLPHRCHSRALVPSGQGVVWFWLTVLLLHRCTRHGASLTESLPWPFSVSSDIPPGINWDTAAMLEPECSEQGEHDLASESNFRSLLWTHWLTGSAERGLEIWIFNNPSDYFVVQLNLGTHFWNHLSLSSCFGVYCVFFLIR